MKVHRRLTAKLSVLTVLALSALATGVLAVTSGGSDVADVVPEWTPDGKKAAAHLATLPPKDEMVLVPPGPFLMGSNRQVGRMADSGSQYRRADLSLGDPAGRLVPREFRTNGPVRAGARSA